jgi:hypothetical protein
MDYGFTQIHWWKSAKENKHHPGHALGAFFIVRLLPEKLEHFLEHFLERRSVMIKKESDIKQ